MGNPSPAEVVARLQRFGLARDRLRSALASRLGIGVTDVDALEHLEHGPLSQRELGARLLVTSGAVTQLVDRLERLRLVRRTAHPTDRRTTLVELRPDAELPDLPEMATYHRALLAAARSLPASSRAEVATMLDDVAQSA